MGGVTIHYPGTRTGVSSRPALPQEAADAPAPDRPRLDILSSVCGSYPLREGHCPRDPRDIPFRVCTLRLASSAAAAVSVRLSLPRDVVSPDECVSPGE